MRKGLWLAGLLAALGVVRPAAAQVTGSGALNYTPVIGTPTNVITNPSLPVAQPMSYSYGTTLANLFHFGPFLSNTTTFGASTFPTQTQMQASTSTYLAAFGYQQPAQSTKKSWWRWWH
jgi:hypothetical protein